MKYVMKTVVDGSIYDVRLGGRKVGCVRKIKDGDQAGMFIAFTTGTGPMRRAVRWTARDAFGDLVAILNRIDLCGEDDHVKARRALELRNQKIAEQNAELARDFAPLKEAIERALGRPLPMPRTRHTKIRI